MDLDGTEAAARVNPGYIKMLNKIAPAANGVLGIPYASNAQGIIVNKTLFKENGIKIPTTWDELIDAANKFEAKGIAPFEMTFLDSWTTLSIWNNLVPTLISPSFVADKKAGKTTFADTHKVVLDKFVQLLELSANEDYMGTSYGDGCAAFGAGKAAMLINGSWAIPEIRKTNADIDLDLIPFPTTDDANQSVAISGIDVTFQVAASSKNAELAKEFLAFITTTEEAQLYVDEQSAFSAISGVKLKDPAVEAISDTISEGRVHDFPDHYYPAGFDLSSILSGFCMNFKNGMNNDTNIQQTLATADAQFDALL